MIKFEPAHEVKPSTPVSAIRDYWVYYGIGNISKVRGTLFSDGGFVPEGYLLSMKSPHFLNKDIFETETAALDMVIKLKAASIEALRAEVDAMEVKKSKRLKIS